MSSEGQAESVAKPLVRQTAARFQGARRITCAAACGRGTNVCVLHSPPPLGGSFSAATHLQHVDGLLVHLVAGVDVGGRDGGLAVLLRHSLQVGASPAPQSNSHRARHGHGGGLVFQHSRGGRRATSFACPSLPCPLLFHTQTRTSASWRRIVTSFTRFLRMSTAALQRLRRAASSGTRTCSLCSALSSLPTSSTPSERAAGGGERGVATSGRTWQVACQVCQRIPA